MPALTVSAAARLCGVDRRTLQRSIQAGRLHLDAQHCVSREALVAAGYLDAPMPHETPHVAPHIAPQETPQELPLVTALLAHLEQLTRTIVALHQEVTLLREDLRQTPQRRRSLAPQETPHAAPLPHHDALTPQDMPHDVADTPQDMPHEPATPASPTSLPAHIMAIAAIAERYDKLSLRELSQLLFDRDVYKATDRATGAAVPVNRGTLTRWLAQAREAGVL